MFGNYQWAYLIGDFVFAFPVWALVFYYRKDLRREMLIAGVLLGALSVATEHWFLRDYWRPENLVWWRISFGDFFYGFFPGGVAAVIYEFMFGKKYTSRKNRRYNWRSFFLPLLLFGAISFTALLHWGINSMYASSLSLIGIAVIIIFFRKDLFWDAVLSSLLFGLFSTLGYLILFAIYPGILSAWWLSVHPNEILIAGIPLSELVFEFSLGMTAGPAYEFIAGYKFRKSR